MAISQTLLSVTACGVAAFVIGCTFPASAQDYPNRPVTIVVPFAAGGGADTVARALATGMAERLGHPVVIDNRVGAAGTIGTAYVARAEADGYTLLMGTVSTHATNAAVLRDLSYDPVGDFAAVALIASAPLLLVVSPSTPAGSVEELIALAHDRPGELNFGTWGNGSINHLAAELFNSMAGIEAAHIPYGGASQSLVDLMSGDIDYAFEGPTSINLIDSGQINLLGPANPAPWPARPDQATVGDTVAGFSAITWFGLFAPADTPEAIVERLNAEVNAVLASPELGGILANLALDPASGPPAVLEDIVAEDSRKWREIAELRGIESSP